MRQLTGLFLLAVACGGRDDSLDLGTLVGSDLGRNVFAVDKQAATVRR